MLKAACIKQWCMIDSTPQRTVLETQHVLSYIAVWGVARLRCSGERARLAQQYTSHALLPARTLLSISQPLRLPA